MPCKIVFSLKLANEIFVTPTRISPFQLLVPHFLYRILLYFYLPLLLPDSTWQNHRILKNFKNGITPEHFLDSYLLLTSSTYHTISRAHFPLFRCYSSYHWRLIFTITNGGYSFIIVTASKFAITTILKPFIPLFIPNILRS